MVLVQAIITKPATAQACSCVVQKRNNKYVASEEGELLCSTEVYSCYFQKMNDCKPGCRETEVASSERDEK